jgi:hypothetical protein
MQFHIFHGATRNTEQAQAALGSHQIIITSYSIVEVCRLHHCVSDILFDWLNSDGIPTAALWVHAQG